MSQPEDRYVSLETKKLPNGKLVYKSARPRSVSVAATDLTLIANERDRLDIMANNAYGSAMDWWRIAAANRRINGSLHITPGTKIIVPK